MNKLAAVAREAVNNPASRSLGEPFPAAKGWCQQFIRLCLQSAYGREVAEKFRAPSAKESAQIWKRLGYSASEPLQPGDLLYKTNGDFGHVGIYVGGGVVAENSSTKIGRVRGALGFRTLEEYGDFDVIGRWPEVKAEPEPVISPAVIIVRDGVATRLTTAKGNGANWAEVRATLAASHLEISKEGVWEDGTPALYLK